MSEDNRNLFSGRAADYAQARPSYAAALLDALYEKHGFSASSRIADIGAGTGKFSELLLARGSTVYSVEPNADMRAECVARLKGYANFVPVAGDAAHTGLPSGSVDIVTAAQAFHWFEPNAFRAECARLTGGGIVAIVYNEHGQEGVYGEIEEIAARYRPERVAYRSHARAAAKSSAIAEFFRGRFAVERADYPLAEDEEIFLRRRLSSSYAPRAGEEGYEGFCAEMRELFARYERGGKVVMENRSVAYIGRV